MIMNSNIITNKTVCKTQQLILYLNFLLSEFIGIAIITSMISSYIIFESSSILFKYAPISEVHVYDSQCIFCTHDPLHSHRHLLSFHFGLELHFAVSNLYL